MAGSARVFPGESASPAASFGPGMALDITPGCAGLAVAADAAAGEDESFAGVSDAELVGVLCAWERVEAHAAARKLAVVAEFYRRRPEPGCGVYGPGRMPVACDEFAAAELAAALGESRARAADLLDLTWQLETRLPGTAAALYDGVISWSKAGIILRATQFLAEAEAAAEAKVLARAGRRRCGPRRRRHGQRGQPRRRGRRAGPAGRAGGGGARSRAGACGVRRAGDPDRAADHLDRPGRAARRARRHRPGRDYARSKRHTSMT